MHDTVVAIKDKCFILIYYKARASSKDESKRDRAHAVIQEKEVACIYIYTSEKKKNMYLVPDICGDECVVLHDLKWQAKRERDRVSWHKTHTHTKIHMTILDLHSTHTQGPFGNIPLLSVKENAALLLH